MTPPDGVSAGAGWGAVPMSASRPRDAAAVGHGRYDGLDLFRAVSIFGVVLFHFSYGLHIAWTPAFDRLLRVRQCALPIIVLTSFFVLTRSIAASPGRTLARFAERRFSRLALPCAIWTACYWAMWKVAGPLWRGGQAAWPPPTLWLSGFSHLWFLQFLFLGSLIALPVVRIVARHPRFHEIAAAVFVTAAVAYWSWGRPGLDSPAWFAWGDRADVNLRVGIEQGIAYATYALVGIAAALVADSINVWYRRPAFQAATLVAAAAALVLHVSAAAPGGSRMLYSLAMFLVLLRPWPPGALDWLRPAARYSYPIYILHPAVAQVVFAAFARGRVPPSVPAILAGSAAVFALSGAAAALLRTLMPADWFLPLVPVGKGGGGAAVS
jgi:peptidoglycan/LPS O-acetylase OafA/YrhL